LLLSDVVVALLSLDIVTQHEIVAKLECEITIAKLGPARTFATLTRTSAQLTAPLFFFHTLKSSIHFALM
jgi:hypothetical protein